MQHSDNSLNVKMRSAWPLQDEIRRLREAGCSWKRIARLVGKSPDHCRDVARRVIDTSLQAPDHFRFGEPEERAFRRFPIRLRPDGE